MPTGHRPPSPSSSAVFNALTRGPITMCGQSKGSRPRALSFSRPFAWIALTTLSHLRRRAPHLMLMYSLWVSALSPSRIVRAMLFFHCHCKRAGLKPRATQQNSPIGTDVEHDGRQREYRCFGYSPIPPLGTRRSRRNQRRHGGREQQRQQRVSRARLQL